MQRYARKGKGGNVADERAAGSVLLCHPGPNGIELDGEWIEAGGGEGHGIGTDAGTEVENVSII